MTERSPCVLVAEDDPSLARAIERALVHAGMEVAMAMHGHEAIELFCRREIDVVITDIVMPGMSGIELLRAVRTHDVDVPVIVMSATPDVESAAAAVEHGAMKYLVKPLHMPALVAAAVRAAKIRRLSALKREAMASVGLRPVPGDRAGLESAFASAVEGLWIAYQPVLTREGKIEAYEALMRTTDPVLPHPGALLDAAERLGALHELGRAVRARVAADAAGAADDVLLYVNLHPEDLRDPALLDAGAPLSRLAPRVVLEITERASLDRIPDVVARVAALRRLGFRIAVDDLGAGYAGLSSFAHLEPEIVKLDMSLIRGVDGHRTRQRVIRSVVELCRDLGTRVVAEGVETPAERATVLELRCDLVQGYLFARPAPPFPTAQW